MYTDTIDPFSDTVIKSITDTTDAIYNTWIEKFNAIFEVLTKVSVNKTDIQNRITKEYSKFYQYIKNSIAFINIFTEYLLNTSYLYELKDTTNAVFTPHKFRLNFFTGAPHLTTQLEIAVMSQTLLVKVMIHLKNKSILLLKI